MLQGLISGAYRAIRALVTRSVAMECDRIPFRFQEVPAKWRRHPERSPRLRRTCWLATSRTGIKGRHVRSLSAAEKAPMETYGAGG